MDLVLIILRCVSCFYNLESDILLLIEFCLMAVILIILALIAFGSFPSDRERGVSGRMLCALYAFRHLGFQLIGFGTVVNFAAKLADFRVVN